MSFNRREFLKTLTTSTVIVRPTLPARRLALIPA